MPHALGIRAIGANFAMKFTEVLEENMLLRWRAYYVNYRAMKLCIEEIEADPSSSNAHFLTMLKSNMLKALTFYEKTEEKLQKKIEQHLATETRMPKSRKDLEHEVKDLRWYAHYNKEAIRKIAKKYDKRCGKSKTMQADLMETLHHSLMANADQRCTALLESLEDSEGELPLTQPLLRTELDSLRKHSRVLQPVLERHTREGDESPTAVVRKPSSMSNIASPLDLIRSWGSSKESLVSVALFLVCLALDRIHPHTKPQLNSYSYFTLFVTLESLWLLLMQCQADVVLISATLVLRLAGALDNDRDAWGGFSNSVVLSVAVLGIVSAGVHHTGVIDFIFMRVLGHPKTYFAAILRLSLPAMPLAASISNTCVMGVMIPVIEKWCKEINMPPRLFLMPMSYIMLVIGAFAIFSTSSNLVAQSLLMERGLEPFGNFEISPLAITCGMATVLYLAIAVPTLLYIEASETPTPTLSPKGSRPLVSSGTKLFLANIQISGSLLSGKSLGESGLLTVPGKVASIVRVERMGEEVAIAGDFNERFELEQYDVLYIWTTTDAILELISFSWVSLIALDGGFEHQHRDDGREVVEVVLDGLCPLVKEQLTSTTMLDGAYGANCLAIRPCSMQQFQKPEAQASEVRTFVGLLRDQKKAYQFHIGDNLILDVPRNFAADYQNTTHFTLVRRLSQDEEESGKGDVGEAQYRDMMVSGALLVMLIILVASNTMPLLEAALLSSFLMVLFGCLPQKKAFSAINLRIVLTIVGAFGIAKAVNKTNLAAVMAHMTCELLAPFGSRVIYAGIFIATVGLGVVFHCTAVVSLLFPIVVAISESDNLPVPLHEAMAVLMMGATCQVLSPVSYQTNIMVFSSGCYTFADFPRVGFGIVIIVGIISVGFVDHLIVS